MSAGQLLKQANQLKREGRLDEAIRLMPQFAFDVNINPNSTQNNSRQFNTGLEPNSCIAVAPERKIDSTLSVLAFPQRSQITFGGEP